jgi:hypothetical protein
LQLSFLNNYALTPAQAFAGQPTHGRCGTILAAIVRHRRNLKSPGVA